MRFIGADSGSLIPHPRRMHGQLHAAFLDVGEALYARFIASRARYWRALHRSVSVLVSDGVLIDTEVYSRGERERLEPYAELMIPTGITSVLCAMFGLPGRETAVLCLNRHAGAEFSRPQAAQLRSVAPLLGLLDAAAASRCAGDSAETGLQVLSLRERQVAALIHDGLQNKEIAGVLGTSVETVRKQTAIYDKLRVEGRVQLVTRFGAALESCQRSWIAPWS